MGWIHVLDQGKGVYLHCVRGINKKYKLPEKEYLYQFFDKDKVDFVDVSDVYHAIAYLGMDRWELEGLMENTKGINKKSLDFRTFCKAYDAGNAEDVFVFSFCNVLEALFCYKYGYPEGCFRGITDYNEDNMFYCCIQYPPRVYNQKIAELTEQKYLEQLRAFLYELTGDKYYKTVNLEFCEVYTK